MNRDIEVGPSIEPRRKPPKIVDFSWTLDVGSAEVTGYENVIAVAKETDRTASDVARQAAELVMASARARGAAPDPASLA